MKIKLSQVFPIILAQASLAITILVLILNLPFNLNSFILTMDGFAVSMILSTYLIK